MQGQRSAIGSLPETLDFTRGPATGDGLDHQPVWLNNLRSSSQTQFPDYIVSSNDASISYIAPMSQERQNLMSWTIGESSSSVAQSHALENEPKTARGVNLPEERRFEPSNVLSLNNEVQGSSSGALACDLNAVTSGTEGDETENDDDCQVMEFFTGNSSTEGRRLSCKRKAIEGQSSGSGSSSFFQHPESSAPLNIASNPNMSSSAQSNIGVSFSDQIHPRLGLRMGDAAASENPIGLVAPRNTETSRRNIRVRISAQQQGSTPRNLLPRQTEPGNVSVSSYRNSIDFRPATIAENPNNPQEQQPILVRVPSVRRQTQTRWNSASSSRTRTPASSAHSEDPNSTGFPRNISQHPLFTPAADVGHSGQNPANWVAGNTMPNSNPPSLVPNRVLSQYPRRLSEYVRRSLLASAAADSGGQVHSGPQIRAGSSSGSQETAPSGGHVHRPSGSRAGGMLERNNDPSIVVPYSLRALVAAGEGRSRLVSEIHNVLDLMRRGEGLRIEDVMILDQSLFFGMSDAHDRHRDMRLDVDNMSYEELLALEERIGNVCTGLSEETISNRLKRRKYACVVTQDPLESEPCCICQEEYNSGEDLGTLECGHDFHSECIKQWLKNKNSCPICKTTGLST